ncbi:hypothetical protein DH2020_009418 [Rehmannia glutinosa]|uniref:DNA repair protein UVH3 n=1 Tax=Rehmannia glutinosa TaxID=99300 RepID=A0ABR0X9B7_REHGL
MGVHGLWELLAPVGRRVSVETLAGKRLAIDASIWIIQFMKAMRDEKGEMVRNAHILGFFRRICKLLYLRTKPVFVFDGGTPALKRRTVIARRRQRDNAQAKIRKTAEKLLLNHLKQMRLKELAADLEKQRQENDVKGKRPSIEVPSNEKGNLDGPVTYNQEELDQMLAASLALEGNEGFNLDASTSGAGVPDDEEDDEDDENEEMILPEMHGKVDPAVLAALPPSMQLDLLVQMRERLMAENRQKYQKVKKAPSRFSELQIEAYLKTVAFRREIDGVQKAAAGRGIGGMQTSRIASEANREFIFSSSFTGDKQTLTSVGKESVGADQSQPPPVNGSTNAVNEDLSSRIAAGPTVAKNGKAFHDDQSQPPPVNCSTNSFDEVLKKAFHDDVETYLDERGRLRVSRVRALGIRMTRDLQRNLDLMKEVDQEKAGGSQEKNSEFTAARNPVDVLDNSSDREITDNYNDEINDGVDKTEELAAVNGSSIEISFEDTLENGYGNDDDDNIFAHLVAGELVVDFSIDNSASAKQSLPSASDNEWEEGVIENKSLYDGGMSDEGEVEWEEGFQDIQLKSSSCPDESHKTVTKGALEEEANIQEAIRRSLEDTGGCRSMNDFHEDHMSERATEMVSEDGDWVSVNEGKEGPEVEASATDVSLPFGSTNALESNYSGAKSAEYVELNPDKSNSNLKHLNQDAGESGALAEETFVASDARPEELCMTGKQPLDTCGEDGNEHDVNKLVGSCSEEVEHNSSSSAFCSSFTDDSLRDRLVDSGSADAKQMFQAALDDHSCSTAELGNISAVDLITDMDGTNELAKEKIYGDFSMEGDEVARNSSFLNDNKDQEIMEDILEEEMLFLGKEREELGSEQRKLERNAESVNNEMFAECQELLQMFGLPYIIAPMEAEAQCAFMELSNLVDGVVTDDSDAFLFGARSVYKNIFDDRKYVETYLMKDIENELGLDREKLIHMALLLGSDYTEGISGIGIVNAIEVVNAFPGKDGLREFREWIESPDPTILGKLDVGAGDNSRRKGSKGSENIMSGSSSNVEGFSCDQHDDATKRIKQIFMDKHRNVSKNWHISSSFPSDAVISAYASPQVDKSTESLSWGKPDLFVLRKLCWDKFGWGASKSDELLLPVLKEYNKHETQLRLEAFYTFNERFAKIRSKRIKKAVKEITKYKSSDMIDETTPQQPGSGKKRKVKPREDEANQSGGDGPGTTNDTVGKPTIKQSKRGRTKEKTSQRKLEESTSVDRDVTTRKESHVRGRGRGRGQGRGQPRGRGRRKENFFRADTETLADDDSISESDEEMHFDKSEDSRQVRRSGRPRKVVNYNVSDELDNSDKETENRLEECSVAKESFVDQAVNGINKSDANELNEGSGDLGIGGNNFVEESEETYRMDKTSASPLDDSRMDDEPFNQTELSKDYLQFGGGFCADEDEETEINEHASSPTTETVPDKSDDCNFADPMVEENPESDPSIVITQRPTDLGGDELKMNDETRSDYHLLDDTENDSGNCYPNSLRSMPNLIRKRKKN